MSTTTAAVPVWHCDLKSTDQLTVGTPFQMNCTGDIAVNWPSAAPQIVLPEKAQPYSLVILSATKLDANAAELIVTSYRTGEIKPDYIRVMSGDFGFEASGLNWKVQTVLKQGQQSKPYGPIGPFHLPMPTWVWVLVALVLASLCSGLWLWFRRVQERRRLAADLGQHANAALTPSAQLHKELRALSRKLIHAADTSAVGEWNAALDQALRVYLMLEFNFLTLRLQRSQLLAGFKRKNREAFEAYSADLKKIFSEMDRFQTHASSHQASEFEQILILARQWCDRIEKDQVKKQRAGRL